MTNYQSTDPVFSYTIPITETTDRAHADNINAAPIQLLQNTVVLAAMLSGLISISYDEDREILVIPSAIPAYVEKETLYLPEGMATVEDETMELSAGSIGSSLIISGGSGASGDYVLPAATATTLGGVKVGEGLTVTSDGTLSADLKSLAEDSEAAAAIVKAGTEDMTDDEVEGAFTDSKSDTN